MSACVCSTCIPVGARGAKINLSSYPEVPIREANLLAVRERPWNAHCVKRHTCPRAEWHAMDLAGTPPNINGKIESVIFPEKAWQSSLPV